MTGHHPGRAGRPGRPGRAGLAPSLVMALVVALVAVITTADVAGAEWPADTAPGGQARGYPQAMTPGQSPTAEAVPETSNNVAVSWAASTGGPLSGYEVVARDAVTGETRAVGGTCSGLVTATNCTDSGAPDGLWTYTIVPRAGAWAGAASAPSKPVVVDTVAPTVTIEFPAPGSAYNADGWNAGCTEPGFCGTADDVGSGLVGGGVAVQQAGTGLYWDGVGFASPFRVLLDVTGGSPGYNVWGFSIDAFPTDGQYTMQAVAIDGGGNSTTASVTFTIDRDGPVTPEGFPAVDGIYGAELWNAGCSQPGVCAGGEAPTDVVDGGLSMLQVDTGLYWDGTAFTSTTEILLPLPTTDVWPFPVTNFPADGGYSVKAVLTDSAGNDTVTVVPFTIDLTAPVLTPTFPLAGGVYDAAEWDAGCDPSGLCGTATDDSGPVASAFVTLQEVGTGFYWDGTAFAGTSDGPMPFQPGGFVPFPATNFTADGVYRARVVVRDVAGNIATFTGTFTFDQSAPVVELTHPLDGGSYTTATWNAGCAVPGICATTSDAGSGLADERVSIRRDADGAYWNGSSFTGTTEAFVSIADGAYPFGAASFPADGAYTVRVEAADFGGHTADDTATFTIDRTAPVVTLTFPAAGSTYNAARWDAGCPTASICTTATDNGGPAATHVVSVRQGTGNYWDGTAFASAAEVLLPVPATGTLAFPAANFPTDGSYMVRAAATDAVGNAATVSNAFTIDKTAPRVVAMTQTNANGYLAAGDELTITFSEPLDLSTICSAWTGTGDRSLTNVTARVTSSFNDVVNDITSPTCTLRAGTLETNNDYFVGGATFSPSTLTWTESTRTLKLRFGTRTSGLSEIFPDLRATSVYTLSPGLLDRAGNAASPATFSATGQRF